VIHRHLFVIPQVKTNKVLYGQTFMCLTVCCGQEGRHQKKDALPPHCWNVVLSLDIWDFYRHAICLVKKKLNISQDC